MCDFIPICIMFGCPRSYSVEDQQAFVCPRCHNASTFKTKEKQCFEVCWIPLVPMGSSHIYMCNICQWQGGIQSQLQPANGGQGGHYQQPQQPGYGYPQQQMGYGGGPPPQGGKA